MTETGYNSAKNPDSAESAHRRQIEIGGFGRKAQSPKAGRRVVFDRLSAAQSITLVLSAALLWYVIRDPSAASAAGREGLSLCARSVIPSLFPFLTLSALLVSSGLGETLGKRLTPVTKRLLGISGSGTVALLLGAFCGFPVGAKIVSELYGRGELGKREAERLLCLSNSPSFAFLFSTVGAGFFGDRTFGLSLYCASLLSTLASGLLLRLCFGVCTESEHTTKPRNTAKLSSVLTESVSGAALSMLTVSAFVVFFSVLSSALEAILSALGAPESVSLVLSGILELTGGMKNAAKTTTEYGLCGRMLCGFFAGWGGLCAHLQVIATADRRLPDRARRDGLSFRSYFLCKLLQGVLSALLVLLLSRS